MIMPPFYLQKNWEMHRFEILVDTYKPILSQYFVMIQIKHDTNYLNKKAKR